MHFRFLLILSLTFFVSCQKEASNGVNKLPTQVFTYASDTNHLSNVQNFKYDDQGRKIETKKFDKDTLHYSTELIEYNESGMISKQHILNKQPNGNFTEFKLTVYTYQAGPGNKSILLKDEDFIGGELTTWRTYEYFNDKLKTKVFHARFPPWNDTIISGKDEFDYNAAGQIKTIRKFYYTNTIPSYTHELIYQTNLLIKENITTNLYPESVDYIYNNNNQLLSKKHYEVTRLLDSEINTYDQFERLSKQVLYNIRTSLYTYTYINVYKY